MNDADILKICERLAKRYKNHNQYDDLVSEGIVACYECREGGKTSKADYVGAARRAMNDYINIKCKAVSIPNSWASRTVSRVMANDEDLEELYGVSGGTLMLLMQAMANDTEMLTPDMSYVPDHAEEYERREYDAYLLSVAITTLTQEEWDIVKMIYFEGHTPSDVADILGNNRMWVVRREKSAIAKLAAKICNKT